MNPLRRTAETALVTVVMLFVLRAQATMAHAEHAHTDDGLDLATILGVASVVAALGIAWLLTNGLSRNREIPGEDSDGPVT